MPKRKITSKKYQEAKKRVLNDFLYDIEMFETYGPNWAKRKTKNVKKKGTNNRLEEL